MVGALLWRGMLLGFFAGLLCFGFLRVAGEPSIERAIAFEGQREKTSAPAGSHMHAGAVVPHEALPELVSRQTQSGLGLFVAVAAYSAAFGGLFALAFALAYGRIADLSPRATAAMLASLGFVAVYLVPLLKYPANPPAVGEADTIAVRTVLYFAMIVLSVAAMVGAAILRGRFRAALGGWNASVAAGIAYLAAMLVVGLALPSVSEVPEDFPATVLWDFRVASAGAQLLLFAALGAGFGAVAERLLRGRGMLAIAR